jgi:hypothetical protein
MELASCYRVLWYPEMTDDLRKTREAAKETEVPESASYALLIIFSVFCVCPEFRERIHPLCDSDRFMRLEKYIRTYFDVFMMRRDAENRFSSEAAKNDIPSFPNWLNFVNHMVACVCANAYFIDPPSYPYASRSVLTT